MQIAEAPQNAPPENFLEIAEPIVVLGHQLGIFDNEFLEGVAYAGEQGVSTRCVASKAKEHLA